MPPRYTHSAKLEYSGCLDDVFDTTPREQLSTCPGGPIRLYGRFERTPVRVDCCSDDTYWVWARSQRVANNLARRMEKKSVEIADKLVA